MIGRSRTDAVDESPDGHDADSAPSELSLDDIYHLLQTKRRRDVLRYLRDAEGRVQLRELAEQVAAWENDTTVREVSSNERKSVYSALHQTHLPKLQAAGVLRYDPERSLVTTTDDASEMDIKLASDPQTTVPWHQLYLVLAGVSLGLLASVWLNVYPLTLLSGIQYALLVIATFGVTALAHTYDLRQWRRRADTAAPDFILELNE